MAGPLQSGTLPHSGKARQPVASHARCGGEAAACRFAGAGELAGPGALLPHTIPDSAPHCHLTLPHDARHICQHVTALAPHGLHNNLGNSSPVPSCSLLVQS